MGLGLSFVGGLWWVMGFGGMVGLGLSLVGLLGGLGGFAWCFPWWLYDVVVVGCVVDGGWWLLVMLLMVGGGCVIDGGSMGDALVDDGSVGGDWKFWVDRLVALFLMVG